MKNIINFIGVVILALFLFSCASDNEKPVIVINEPVENELFNVGDEIHVDFNITDNDELNQFKIDIHGNQDGHSHGKLNAVFPAFDTIIIDNITGNSINRHIHIDIPDGIWPGPYHIIVYATDKGGNEAMEMKDIKIQNLVDTKNPTISITAPTDGATLSSSFLVTATITDQLSDSTSGEIRTIQVALVKGSEEIDLGKFDEVTNFSGAFNQSTGQFSRSFDLPSGISPGNWELEIVAYDSYFNIAHAHIEVNIP